MLRTEFYADGVTKQIEWDSSAATVTGWGPDGALRFVRALTPREAEGERARALIWAITDAIATNVADITQAQTIRAQADTLAGGSGTYTTAQLSGYVRQLAAGVRLLADHDIVTKRQLNGIIRLVADRLDSIDGTA